jgi:hypothetical protein
MAQLFPQRTGIPPTSFISLADTPNSYVGQASNFVRINAVPDGLEFVTPGVIASIIGPLISFLSLSDTPASYVGQANRVVRVDAGENGLEFVTTASILAFGSFLNLSDTPGSYVGQANNLVRVNAVPNGLEFVTPAGAISGVPIAPSGFSPNIRSQNSDAVQSVNDYTILIDASLGNRQVTVLSAIGNQGRILNVKKIDATANIVTLLPIVGGQTIDGAPTYVLTVQYQSVTIQSDNANWFII